MNPAAGRQPGQMELDPCMPSISIYSFNSISVGSGQLPQQGSLPEKTNEPTAEAFALGTTWAYLEGKGDRVSDPDRAAFTHQC